MLWDELLVWVKLADLYRDLPSAVPADRTPIATLGPGPWASPRISAGVWRTLRACPPVVEPPRLDAQRILGRWLARRRSAGRLLRGV